MEGTLPPLGALRAFALVAETGSLTAAAAALNVTQPAISKRLRLLEATLGVALLRRGANAVALTEAGERYAAEVTAAFARLRAATAALDARPAPLRLRAYTTWALRWLIPRLPDFRARHPGLEVELATSTALVDFAREGMDAAVRSAPAESPPAPGALRLQPLLVAPFAAPALAGPARHRRDLGEMRLLGSRVRPQDWAVWLAAQGRAAATPPLLFESTSLAIQAALEGLGAVICAPAFVAEDVRRRRLVPLAPGTTHGAVPSGDHYWLILPPAPRPEALAFRDWLRAAVAE
ncbi:LysR substrate-binding domain-containing protein [Roseomonas sp. E05]|uniref:LysR family transcriptional regulator n=1 Tax=Roseomonas sp. E05 TaxID=3046310 RepID=UPI0024B92081|nr:LysR family transcriptional regulator [Roseomonas sp. E05]MDJ0388917.1 LysR substrate-binding domain-containing protein [Roseomonas sp. E05]